MVGHFCNFSLLNMPIRRHKISKTFSIGLTIEPNMMSRQSFKAHTHGSATNKHHFLNKCPYLLLSIIIWSALNFGPFLLFLCLSTALMSHSRSHTHILTVILLILALISCILFILTLILLFSSPLHKPIFWHILRHFTHCEKIWSPPYCC